VFMRSNLVTAPPSRARRCRDDCPSERRFARNVGERDRLLAADEEPPLGAHLLTPRLGYAHHGIYVGAGTVVHYAAFAYRCRRGPVEEVSLSRFAHGHSLWVRTARPSALPCEEVVRRARSRIGEDSYRLLSNNCEHFAEWCVRGEHRSRQAERLLAPLRWVSRELGLAMRWLTGPPEAHT